MKLLSAWQFQALGRAVPQWNLRGYFSCGEFALADLVKRGLMETREVTTVLENDRKHLSTLYRVTAAGAELHAQLKPHARELFGSYAPGTPGFHRTQHAR